ncbi:hypothetical protein GCM10009434_26550 [Brevundimonas olei]
MEGLPELLMEFDHIRLIVAQRLFKRRHPLPVAGQAVSREVAVVVSAFAAEDAEFRLLRAASQGPHDRLHGIRLGCGEVATGRQDDSDFQRRAPSGLGYAERPTPST